MNPEDVIQEAEDLHEALANQLWTEGEYQEKLKKLRDDIGEFMPAPLVNPYGQIITGVNPSDQAFIEWTLSQRLGFTDWARNAWN